ncbi:MAG: DUF3159 domain-containing protein [Actinomycetia bacterium]|nr:DUF3159 domain-containing protein [Actinomycetes bacterium]
MTEPEPTPVDSKATEEKKPADDMSAAISQGIGGSAGLFDSGAPTAVFVVVYLVSGSQLYPAIWSAVAAGVIVAIVRRIRGESLRHIATGLIGLGIAAFLAARTGRAEDFFLPGILINIGYCLLFAVSALLRRPLVGYAAGAVVGDLSSWRGDDNAYRGAVAATWAWAAMFGARVAVQLPLYLAGLVGALGVAKLAMGWPLFLFVGYVSYRIMRPRMNPEVMPAATTESESDDPDQAPST